MLVSSWFCSYAFFYRYLFLDCLRCVSFSVHAFSSKTIFVLFPSLLQVGNNFRQQIGRVLGRIGKHSSQRYTAVSGHATSDKDERVGQADSPSRSSGRRRDTTFGHVNNRTGKEYSDVMSEGKPDSGQRQRHGSISCEGDVRKPGSDTYSLTRLGSTTGHGQASGFGDTLKNTFHSRRITIMNLVHVRLLGCSTGSAQCVRRLKRKYKDLG